jgi:hypothetical protein
MDNYGTDMKGPIKIEELATLPANSPTNCRRLIYVAATDKFYYGGATAWIEFANYSSLLAHINLTTAHGSDGAVVGANTLGAHTGLTTSAHGGISPSGHTHTHASLTDIDSLEHREIVPVSGTYTAPNPTGYNPPGMTADGDWSILPWWEGGERVTIPVPGMKKKPKIIITQAFAQSPSNYGTPWPNGYFSAAFQSTYIDNGSSIGHPSSSYENLTGAVGFHGAGTGYSSVVVPSIGAGWAMSADIWVPTVGYSTDIGGVSVSGNIQWTVAGVEGGADAYIVVDFVRQKNWYAVASTIGGISMGFHYSMIVISE